MALLPCNTAGPLSGNCIGHNQAVMFRRSEMWCYPPFTGLNMETPPPPGKTDGLPDPGVSIGRLTTQLINPPIPFSNSMPL
jgi:hypothetical protein